MALKFVNKSKTKLKNFLREVSITNSLSSSPFIIKVFDVVFETEDCYVFAQEYAPAGDLFDIIPPQVGGTGRRGGHLNAQSAGAGRCPPRMYWLPTVGQTLLGCGAHSEEDKGPPLLLGEIDTPQ